MGLAQLLDLYGHRTVLAAGGLCIGLCFGFLAQRSRFCLRAAVIEFWHRQFGEKLSVWLLAFSSAVIGVQLLVLGGWLDTSSARQISAPGSISGAVIGGVLFGTGMVMTRGCASRLLVLSANGNLRALLSGLIFAVTAQAAVLGALSPIRTAISAWWTVDGGAPRDLLALTGMDHTAGLYMGGLWLAAALYFALRYENDPEAALIANANCGGDSAARGIVIGMLLGALHTTSALPRDHRWARGLNALPRVEALIDTLVRAEKPAGEL